MLLMFLACVGGTDVKVGVYNTPPSASILYPTDGSTFNEGDVIDFEAIIADGQDSIEDLEVLWTSDLQGSLLGGDLPQGDGTLFYSTANLTAGNHVITLSVTDTSREVAQATTSLEIIDLPEQPGVEILHPTSAESGIENQPFDLEATVFDARDEANLLSVTMSSDQQGELCAINAEENGRALCTVTLDPGQHLLLFTVRNSAEYEATASTYFDVIALVDIDNDGDGFSENQGDCDDENPTTAPGATEIPNNVDDNCDGRIDEGTTRYDDDGDGFTEEQGDCDDANFQLNPAATEVCGDGVDNNCNNTQNELNADSCTTFYRDADGDGYGDPNFSECWCSAGGSTGEFTETNDSDCYDGNPDANITQSGYFGMDRGDGSFDYNCDSSDEQELQVIGSCSSWGSSVGDCTYDAAGWESSVPACGQSSGYIYDNDSCSAGCEVFGVPFCCEVGGPSYTSRIQNCR